MTTGRTVLILKDEEKGSLLNKFRPIACQLPVTYKLSTGMMAHTIYEHLHQSNELPVEQEGCIQQEHQRYQTQTTHSQDCATQLQAKKTNLKVA